MPLDWSKLAPHRPLSPQDPLHVRRPDGGGDEIARWIAAGADAIAIAGPVGSGKSTELAWAASSVGPGFISVQVPLDRLVDMHRITEDQVLILAADIVVSAADAAKVVLSAPLKERVRNAMSWKQPLDPGMRGTPARDTLLQALREVTKASRRSLALFVDGIEKCRPDKAVEIARALLGMRGEAKIILVAPFALVIGSGAHELLSNVDRIFFLQAIPVRRDQGESGEAGRAFLREILRVRLDLQGLPVDLAALLDRAAEASGGVPRSFLQIVRAAATYATLAERESMTGEDLDRAMHDHAESLERLLVEGDIEQLRSASGTSGVEIPEERRLRLLSHGLLLEYRTAGGGIVVHPAPLLERALKLGASA